MSDAEFGYLVPETLGLFADRYEFTMQRAYREAGHTPEATFSLFFRDLPPNRGYVIAAGLEQVVHAVEAISYGDRAVEHLSEEGFPEPFLDWLRDFEFTGDVRAIPEGTPVFPNEPLVEVTAPLEQAQLFETLLVNQVGFQSLVATKAARMRDVVDRWGDGQTLVEFGSRRAHGTDAGVKAARAAYLGWFDGTSLEAAGEAFDLPVFGTMAHSWVQSFPTERAAFDAYLEVYGEDAVLLIDTYDTVAGARTAVEAARDAGVDLRGVRLDSGDLAALSTDVREVVGDDAAVFVSSGVDEYALVEFFEAGGVADGFGPGTALATSADAPTLDPVYKLVAVERDGVLEPTMKLSTGKVNYPGRKSVRRVAGPDGYERDVLARRGDPADGEELLVEVVSGGETVYDPPALDVIRDRARDAVRKLPPAVRAVQDPAEYPVEIGEGLAETAETLERDLRDRLDL